MIFLKIILFLFRIFPLNKNLILFMEGSYNSFNGNCRAIYEKLKKNKNYKFVLLVKDEKQTINLLNLIISKYSSIRTFYYLATAKYRFFTTEAYKAFSKEKDNCLLIFGMEQEPLKNLG